VYVTTSASWLSLSLSLQCSAIEQVLDILTDILSWEIAEVVSPCLPRSLWSEIVIGVFLLLGTVCPQHLLYPVLPSCPFSRAFPYPQPGDAGGRRSAPAICQSLTSADRSWLLEIDKVTHISNKLCSSTEVYKWDLELWRTKHIQSAYRWMSVHLQAHESVLTSNQVQDSYTEQSACKYTDYTSFNCHCRPWHI